MEELTKKLLLQLDLQGDNATDKLLETQKVIKALKEEKKKLEDVEKNLAKANKQGTAEYENNSRKLIDVKANLKASTDQARRYEQQLTNIVKVSKDSEGSLDQQRATLSALTREYSSLAAVQREGSDEGLALQKQIADLTAGLKASEGSLGDFRRNVGNYTSALDALKDKLGELRNEKLQVNTEGFKDVSREAEKTESNVAASTEVISKDLVLVGKAALQQAGSVKELRQVYKTLQDASLVATGEVKKDLERLAAQAKDRINDIRGSINSLASDTANFDAATEGIKGVVSVFTVFEGASQVFGASQEEVQQAIQKTNALMAILNGLTEIQNVLQKESVLRLKVSAATQRIYSLAVGQSIGLMKAFRIALAATGIGLLVVGLIALISNFDKFKKAFSETIDSMGKGGAVVASLLTPFRAIGDALKFIAEGIGLIDSEAVSGIKNQLEGQKKASEVIEQRYDREIKLAQAAGLNTDELEKRKLASVNSNIQAQIVALERLRLANGDLNEDQIDQLNELQKAYKDNLTTIQSINIKASSELQKANAEAAKAEQERIKQAQEKRAQEAAKALESYRNALSGLKDLADSALEDIRNSSESPEDAIKSATDAELKKAADLLDIAIKNSKDRANAEREYQITVDAIRAKEANDFKALQEEKEAAASESLKAIEEEEKQIAESIKNNRLAIEQQSNDAFRELTTSEYELRLEELAGQQAQELLLYEDNEAKKLEITQKYDALRANLQKIQFDQELAATATLLNSLSGLFEQSSDEFKFFASAEALINTYRAVAQVFADKTLPSVAKPILAASYLIGGLANVAKINAVQFYDGGYTGDGNPRSESTSAGKKPYVYHKGEYIIPHKVLRMPQVSSYVSTVLEPLRRSGSYYSGLQGMANGGFTSSATSLQSIDTVALVEGIASIVNNQPQPVLVVEDVNTINKSLNRVVARANI